MIMAYCVQPKENKNSRVVMKTCFLNCFRNDQELRCPADQLEVKDSQV